MLPNVSDLQDGLQDGWRVNWLDPDSSVTSGGWEKDLGRQGCSWSEK